MSGPALRGAPLLVAGAGIMGAGIAQVAAQAGHRVFLFDMREGAAVAAKRQLGETLAKQVAKGRLDAGDADATLARIEPVATLEAAASARMVVEAIVEDLQAKRGLFRQIEGLVADDAVLATNTSSISVTAIANGLRRPGRVVGMHFFNPVPLMNLVEVVRGLQTDLAVADATSELAKDWGKVPVFAKSTPGFIVNRIARPYYAETLALLQEQAAQSHELDACLVAAGFRMGPCELMDLIGHDTNFAVTRSVYEATFCDKRFVPSLVQRELVDGGLLGRKSGQGFYRYEGGTRVPPATIATAFEAPAPPGEVAVHGSGPVADWLAKALGRGARPDRWCGLTIDGARLVLTDGRPATELAALWGLRDVAVFDRFDPRRVERGAALAYAAAEGASAEWPVLAAQWLARLGFLPTRLVDLPGLVVARTLAMLVNEAADAVAQGVCTAQGADDAMKLGVNYPQGPFEWLAAWDATPAASAAGVVNLLDALNAHYRGERYRASPWLRRRSLVQEACHA
jgi:3-hydroxybutyryl-CoA dehydrogenase